VPGKPAAYFKYDIVGNVTQTFDPQGHTVDLTTSLATNYAAPGVVTPNSNTNLASSFTYTSFLGIATATAPNASTSSYTYDAYARPATTTSPHGAVTRL
jgi:YD repeat-containing protein